MNNKHLILLISVVFLTFQSCKKKGCTDSSATNYSTEAKKDDGSCTYYYQTVKSQVSYTLNGNNVVIPFSGKGGLSGSEYFQLNYSDFNNKSISIATTENINIDTYTNENFSGYSHRIGFNSNSNDLTQDPNSAYWGDGIIGNINIIFHDKKHKVLEGTFNVTLYNPNGDELTFTNGKFGAKY